MGIAEFVALPGFFRLESGTRTTGIDTWEPSWLAGADPQPERKPTGRVEWGEGATAEAAVADWERRHYKPARAALAAAKGETP